MENTKLAIETENLDEKLKEIDNEFKSYLSTLTIKKEFNNDDKLGTFSPLDAVADFEQDGIQAVREVSRDEMLANDGGVKKLLANMLSACKPGSLSDEDVTQISGINGRDLTHRL